MLKVTPSTVKSWMSRGCAEQRGIGVADGERAFLAFRAMDDGQVYVITVAGGAEWLDAFGALCGDNFKLARPQELQDCAATMMEWWPDDEGAQRFLLAAGGGFHA
jgi:hypothetical protein